MKKLFFSCFFLFNWLAVGAQETFKGLEGESISLEQNRGKLVLLAVGATWLPLSKQQSLVLNRLVRKYSSEDVVFYFVAVDSNNPKSRNFASDDQIRSFANENKINVKILRDSDGVIVRKLKVSQLPSFVLIGKDGQLVEEPISGLSEENTTLETLFNQLSQKIDRLLKMR